MSISYPIALKQTMVSIVAGLSLILPSVSFSKVDSNQAETLRGDLTPTGAERKANNSGTIPVWDGGITTPPASYQGPGSFHEDLFNDDEAINIIKKSNLEEYRSLLSLGQIALLERYPDTYRIRLYPTHRTHAAPKWLYKNTYINALNAELTEDGAGIKHAFGGVPFPIPNSGTEIIWNHLTRWRGIHLVREEAEAVVFPNGTKKVIVSEQDIAFKYYKPREQADDFGNILFYYMSHVKSPPQLAGGALLLVDTLNQKLKPRQSWGYNAGQRRVRRLPLLAHDSPALLAESVRTADDTDMFSGSPTRYNWTVLGKKDIIVPYNCYQMGLPTVKLDDLLTPHHLNPEYIRNEIHRVWVVEGVLKRDENHIYSKRIFYVDEDSWGILVVENYDRQGNLWRVGLSHTRNVYEVPGVMPFADTFHDLKTGQYNVKGLQNEAPTAGLMNSDLPPDENYTPAALRKKSHR